MNKETQPRLRENLTPEEKEKALKIGRIEFKSARPAWDPGVTKFIPSQAQH